MKLSVFLLMVMISAIPTRAIAQTPNTDKEATAVKEFLWKKGMNSAPTDIYLAALDALRTEMCGRPDNRAMIAFYLRSASVDAPASVIESWFQIMKQKMKTSLMLNPEEAQAFCK